MSFLRCLITNCQITSKCNTIIHSTSIEKKCVSLVKTLSILTAYQGAHLINKETKLLCIFWGYLEFFSLHFMFTFFSIFLYIFSIIIPGLFELQAIRNLNILCSILSNFHEFYFLCIQIIFPICIGKQKVASFKILLVSL